MTIDLSEPRSCPPLQVWPLVVQGDMNREEAHRLLAHAAECDTCGALLREASTLLCVEATPAEEARLRELASSRSEWQRSMAAQLTSHQPKLKREKRYRHPILWTAVGALAASLALLAVWRFHTGTSPDTLLAAAYNRERLTELRIPGGEPVPLHSPQRAAGTGHETPELLEARLMAERGLERDSTSANWHQLLGRVFVLEMQPESALSELQRAELRNPDLDRLQFDLGTAYFEMGESREAAGNLSDYARAAEHFSRFLASEGGTDSVALYDRSLCWQALGETSLALRDLNDALRHETDARWKQAIEERIRTLQTPPKSGSGDAAGTSSNLLTDGYEEKLSSYLESLPSSAPGGSVALAQLGLTHRDSWFADWLKQRNSRHEFKADQALASAVRLNFAGEAAGGLQSALEARRRYQDAGDLHGSLRAQAEVVYAVRRMGQTQRCLDELASLPSTRQYSWLTADLDLERAACLSQDGDFEGAKLQAQRAIHVADESALPIIGLRARGFLADFLTQQGLLDQALTLNALGLRAASRATSAPMRTYQFISDLSMDAELLGLHQTAALLASDGVSRAAKTGNLQIEAYAWEVVGRDWLKANGLKQAEVAFSEADRVLDRLGENPATETYRADWAADRADLAFLQHDDFAAMARLETAMPVVDATNDLFIEEQYWANRSEIERRMGRIDAARQSADRAVELSESALLKMNDFHKRAAWQQMSEPQYKNLVEVLLLKHQENRALQEWLWFRSAPERPAGAAEDSQAAYYGSRPAQHNTLANAAVLVYVRLPDKYVIMAPSAAASGSVRAIQVAADPDHIDDMVRTYSNLCSDPQSNIEELRALGAELYSILLAPAISNNVEELRLDLPSSLMRIPFETLVMPNGDYLGSKIRIVSLSPDWGFHRFSTDTMQALPSRLLLVDAQAANSGASRIPEQYDESDSLRALFPARQLQSLQGNAGLQEVLAALGSATAFHFVGHADTSGGTVRLLLGDTNTSGSFLDASAIEHAGLKHCKIAFLAACSTSGSPRALDEGATLPLAFVRAGAEDVVSSRWDVDSEASSRLAILFYRNLEKGKSPAEALKQAEGTVRNLAKFQHPYYWACFSLMEG